MTSHNQRKMAEFCLETATRAADTDGFVPIRKLVELFGAEVETRPLLVEGMIAAPRSAGAKWMVLLDADSVEFERGKFEQESTRAPLSPRLRFTVAHELSHILSFRAKELGVELRAAPKGQAQAVLVNQLEKIADGLSPLLLIAETALEQACAGTQGQITLNQIATARKHLAVGRETLISRLSLLHTVDPKSLRFRTAFRNLALGLAEWQTTEKLVLLDWPAPFQNFDDGIVPEFLLAEKGHQLSHAMAAFSDQAFCLHGGPELSSQAQVFSGTVTNPRSEQLITRLEFEDVPRRKGSRCLYSVTAVKDAGRPGTFP